MNSMLTGQSIAVVLLSPLVSIYTTTVVLDTSLLPDPTVHLCEICSPLRTRRGTNKERRQINAIASRKARTNKAHCSNKFNVGTVPAIHKKLRLDVVDVDVGGEIYHFDANEQQDAFELIAFSGFSDLPLFLWRMYVL